MLSSAIKFTLGIDDLSHPQTQALIGLHLTAMRAGSPPEQAFALELSALKSPEITVWSAWQQGKICGIGAIKALADNSAELKSMRTHPDFLRCGVAAAILETAITTARRRGYWRLSLETGRGEMFEPALRLYRRRGFCCGEAFSDYQPSAFNQFYHLLLADL